jgi:hypothetical protein
VISIRSGLVVDLSLVSGDGVALTPQVCFNISYVYDVAENLSRSVISSPRSGSLLDIAPPTMPPKRKKPASKKSAVATAPHKPKAPGRGGKRGAAGQDANEAAATQQQQTYLPPLASRSGSVLTEDQEDLVRNSGESGNV